MAPVPHQPRIFRLAAPLTAGLALMVTAACGAGEATPTTPAQSNPVGIQPAPVADAGLTADEALARIDALIHEWEIGDRSADRVLAEIEDLLHDLPPDEMTETLAAVDRLLHEWEEGELSAEEALERVDALLHP